MRPIAYVLVVLLFAPLALFGQGRVLYHENTFERTYVKCQIPPTFGNDSLALQNYFCEKLQAAIKRAKGLVTVSVLIDTTGMPLCEWIENNTNVHLHGVALAEIVDDMPNWHCGLQNGYKVNCAGLLELAFDNKVLTVNFRIGKK